MPIMENIPANYREKFVSNTGKFVPFMENICANYRELVPIMENICASYGNYLFVPVTGYISANYWEHSCQLWGTFVPVMGNICASSRFIFLLYTTNILVTMF